MIDLERQAADGIDYIIGAKAQDLRQLEEELAAQEALLQPIADYSTTEEYAQITSQIAELKNQLSDIRATTETAAKELTAQIAELDGKIEAAQEKLAALRFVEQQDARIKELEEREKELGAEFENLQKGLYLCELYTRKQAELLDEKINSRFETLRFRLFIEQQNGGIADDCEALVPCEGRGLIPFKSANNAARINAGLEVIDTLGEYYGTQLPVFIDNSESVTKLRPTNTQTIRLVVSEADKALRFETE